MKGITMKIGKLIALIALMPALAFGQATKAPQQATIAVGLAAEEAELKKLHEKEGVLPIILLSGSPGATYDNVVKDIVPFCAKDLFTPFNTQGGWNNAVHMAHNDAEAGLSQVDNLVLVGTTDPSVRNLRSLVSLYNAGVHIIVNPNGWVDKGGMFDKSKTFVMKGLQDLKGKPVAVWSSAQGTANNINVFYKSDMRFQIVTTYAEGLAALDKGEVVAFIAMAGRGTPWVKKLAREKYRILSLTDAEIAGMKGAYPDSGYDALRLTYDNLGQVNVPTVGVGVELVVRNFKGKQGEALARLRDCIVEHRDDIRERRGSQPVWEERTAQQMLATKWPTYEFKGRVSSPPAAPQAGPAPVVPPPSKAVIKK
jgi:TRAP-type uncharacterized transport system substrate-binding protein